MDRKQKTKLWILKQKHKHDRKTEAQKMDRKTATQNMKRISELHESLLKKNLTRTQPSLEVVEKSLMVSSRGIHGPFCVRQGIHP